ncbi:MAG: hypothetical protein ABIL45_04235 [candidate division WOR-3 bacterium]
MLFSFRANYVDTNSFYYKIKLKPIQYNNAFSISYDVYYRTFTFTYYKRIFKHLYYGNGILYDKVNQKHSIQISIMYMF